MSGPLTTSVVCSIRLPADLLALVDAAAADAHVSRNRIVEHACRQLPAVRRPGSAHSTERDDAFDRDMTQLLRVLCGLFDEAALPETHRHLAQVAS